MSARVDLRDVRRDEDGDDEERRPYQDRGAPYRVLKVRAIKGGGEEIATVPASFSTRRQAIEAAERTQVGLFDSCQPVRTYVVDRSGVKVYRAAGDREVSADEPQPRGRERLDRQRVG